MNKLFTFIFSIILVFGIILIPATSLAQSQPTPGDQGFVPCGSFSDNPCQLTDVFNLVITITNFLISLAGVVAVVVIIFAGWSMIFAAGNTEEITASKKLLVNAVIGLFLVMTAFAGTNILIFGGRQLIKGEPTQGGTPVGIFVCPIDYILGNQVCGQAAQNSGGNNGGGNNTSNTPRNTNP